jgi:RNA polymerase sigma factor (sigma-70 family)
VRPLRYEACGSSITDGIGPRVANRSRPRKVTNLLFGPSTKSWTKTREKKKEAGESSHRRRCARVGASLAQNYGAGSQYCRVQKPPGWSESPLANLPDEATSVSRRAARDEGLRRFIDRLQDLDDADRRLLLYRGLEDLSHAEIGGLLHLSRDAVEKRWQRLQKKIEPWAPPADLFLP